MELGTITYLDNAAAMPVKQDILSLFTSYSEKYFANPEAVHGAGREVMTAIKDASLRVLEDLGCNKDYSLSWTASATEAINIAVAFEGFKGKIAVTTNAEHSAMASAIGGADFCEIRKVSIGQDGMVDLADLESKLYGDVGVVAIHHVQNESGATQNLTDIRKVLNRKSPNAVFIVDTVQSVGKIDIPWKEAKINIGFIGGHKIGTPSGGALIYNIPGNRFLAYLNSIRKEKHSIGRPDPAICLCLAQAISITASLDPLEKISDLNRYLRNQLGKLKSKMELDLILPIPEHLSSPYITIALLTQYQAEVLVRMLSDKGVMVSAGSACEASKDKPSQTLLAMGISAADARTALRISFAFDSDKEDVDRFIEAFKDVISNY